MGKTIKAAIIGAGMRSQMVMNCLRRSARRKLEIVSIYDPDTEVAAKLMEKLNADSAVLTDSAEAAVNAEGVDWVLIFSPNAFHCEHILMSFAAGKHVFSEKPLATTIEDCLRINTAHKRSGKLFATGFVLRYSPIYRKVKELLDSGVLGRIMSIEANENIAPDHGGYIMTNWRRKTEIAGPHILEKCCHDLDLLEWFTDSLPSKVSAFSDRQFFIPENAYLIQKHSKELFLSWPDPHRIDTPFEGDGDLDDMLFSIAEFRNKVQVSFSATMCNCIPERRMRFHCQSGTLVVELYSMILRYRLLGETEERVINFGASGTHAGGDYVLADELWDSMQNNTLPVCSGAEGLKSAVYALALDQSAREGRPVDLETVWKELEKQLSC